MRLPKANPLARPGNTRPLGTCKQGAAMTFEAVRDVLYCASSGEEKPMSLSTLHAIEQRALAKLRIALERRN